MECIIFLESTKFQECVWSAWILVCKWSPGSAFGVRTFQQKKMWECVGVRWRILECVWSAHSLRTSMHCKRTFQPQGYDRQSYYHWVGWSLSFRQQAPCGHQWHMEVVALLNITQQINRGQPPKNIVVGMSETRWFLCYWRVCRFLRAITLYADHVTVWHFAT